jgi:hypothetical protein
MAVETCSHSAIKTNHSKSLRPTSGLSQARLTGRGNTTNFETGPSEQEIGGERVKEDRRRRPGREDALDPVGNSDGASGRTKPRAGAMRAIGCGRLLKLKPDLILDVGNVNETLRHAGEPRAGADRHSLRAPS